MKKYNYILKNINNFNFEDNIAIWYILKYYSSFVMIKINKKNINKNYEI